MALIIIILHLYVKEDATNMLASGNTIPEHHSVGSSISRLHQVVPFFPTLALLRAGEVGQLVVELLGQMGLHLL